MSIQVTVEVEEHGLEATVDADIRRFGAYFQSLGNDPLVRSEIAILKTYMHWKVKVEGHGAKAADGSAVLEVRPQGDAGGVGDAGA
jgi:hypothetical protein